MAPRVPPIVTYADFIALFPEFGDTSVYPVAQFNAWEPIAVVSLNVGRLLLVWKLAVGLFVAHNMVLSARNAAAATAGQIVGQTNGVLTSKEVGDVSASYDASVVAIQGAGYWNATSYGARLYKMFQSYGTGPNYAPGPAAIGRVVGPVPRFRPTFR